MDVKIRVTPAQLKAKSDEITDLLKDIDRNWNQICQIIERTSYYWKGEASDYHQKMLREEKEDMADIIKRLKEHPKDLLTIAGEYERVEQDVKQAAIVLPKDVIV